MEATKSNTTKSNTMEHLLRLCDPEGYAERNRFCFCYQYTTYNIITTTIPYLTTSLLLMRDEKQKL